MIPSPLLLKGTNLLQLSFEHASSYSKDEAGFSITVSPELHCSDDLRTWIVIMGIQVGPNDQGKLSPYNVKARYAGHFEWNGSRDGGWKVVAKAVGISGFSLLYSQFRELLLLVSSRGEEGPYQLPTVSFADFDPDEQPTRRGEPAEHKAPKENQDHEATQAPRKRTKSRSQKG